VKLAGNVDQGMQCPIDSRGIWKDSRNLRIKHHDVRVCPDPLEVLATLKLLEVRAFVLRSKFIGCGLNPLHKFASPSELPCEH
jgi:hypothetical protein